MGGYSAQPWRQRFALMGDESEATYEAVQPWGASERFGFRRPGVSMRYMESAIRHAPDYYATSGVLVECGGMGRDGIFKLKLSKLEALADWHRLQSVVVFVWNTSKKEWVGIPYPGLRALARRVIKRDGTKFFEADGNEYVPLEWKELVRVKGAIRGQWHGES